ncbi:MAG: hypothetical protein H0U54_14280 [Acidobacteria bacterium]|nr:hypothetical protein [Acidobacteriota bacterium]
MRAKKKSLNYITLMIFAPVLILAGGAGFLIPGDKSLTSGAMPYNIFHLISGSIGLAILLTRREKWIIGFNIVFGLIDLYQALASYMHLFPEKLFRWTRVDDILHIILGLMLVGIGCYGAFNRRQGKSHLP